jgi:hypothetical protein
MGGRAEPPLPASAAMVADETPTRSDRGGRAFPASASLIRSLIRLRSRGSYRLVTVLAAMAIQPRSSLWASALATLRRWTILRTDLASAMSR